MISKKEKLQKIRKNNGVLYNKLKAVEELNELATAITQSITKKSKSDDDIIEEFGDVLYRLDILRGHYDNAKIKKRYNHKLEKSIDYLKNKSYKKV